MQHIGMVVVDEPAVERAVLHPVPSDTDRTIATAFDVWIEELDTDHTSWPGKEAGTAFTSPREARTAVRDDPPMKAPAQAGDAAVRLATRARGSGRWWTG